MERTARTTLSDRIESLSLPQAAGYADFIRSGEAAGPLPCWGAIVERFDQDFGSDEDRLALWAGLLEAGDLRALTLFVHANRGRPEVMEHVLANASRLPRLIQRAVVSLEEVEELVPDHVDDLHPAARQLWEAGPDARARERELFEARVAELMSFRFFVRSADDPIEAEPPGKDRRPEAGDRVGHRASARGGV